jgi:signal transduction histidine kinase
MLATARVDIDETFTTSHPGSIAGPHVRLLVSDSGTGMDAEVRRRVFEPFFTTKPVGKGTGLGLSISYSLIARHGGSISATSKPGEGATFRIKIPATTTAASAVPVAQ